MAQPYVLQFWRIEFFHADNFNCMYREVRQSIRLAFVHFELFLDFHSSSSARSIEHHQKKLSVRKAG